jgi:HAD superfamily hydrolase (TIGR01549 family)
MGQVKTVIFDFDGTLANSVDLIFDLYNSHADEFGYIAVERAEFSALRRMGYTKAMRLKKIKARKIPKIIMVLSKEMQKKMNTVAPYEGIVDVLFKLQKEGYNIGVLTSNQASLVQDFFKKHKFPEFDFVVSEKTLFGKHKALKKIFKSYGLSKDEVIYVGDEPRDVIASHKAGVKVIGVLWGLGGSEGFEKNIPNFTASKPLDILSIVNRI